MVARKNRTPDAPVAPVSFAELKTKQTRERVHRYRVLLTRHARGENLSEAELFEVSELLEQLGRPDTAWATDLEALHRFEHVEEKFRTATDAVPHFQDRVRALGVEIEQLKRKLSELVSEQRVASAKVGKPDAYGLTLDRLRKENVVALGDLASAVEERLSVLNRRKEMVAL